MDSGAYTGEGAKVMDWTSSKDVDKAQENTDKIIAKNGGERTKDGKWDMSKGVDREKEKANGR